MAALIALSVGLVVIVIGQGFSTIGAVRALEDVALGVIVATVLMGGAARRRSGLWPSPNRSWVHRMCGVLKARVPLTVRGW